MFLLLTLFWTPWGVFTHLERIINVGDFNCVYCFIPIWQSVELSHIVGSMHKTISDFGQHSIWIFGDCVLKSNSNRISASTYKRIQIVQSLRQVHSNIKSDLIRTHKNVNIRARLSLQCIASTNTQICVNWAYQMQRGIFIGKIRCLDYRDQYIKIVILYQNTFRMCHMRFSDSVVVRRIAPATNYIQVCSFSINASNFMIIMLWVYFVCTFYTMFLCGEQNKWMMNSME